MGRNIVVFSDGTGQDGGVRPDQRMSNVYKLFRATRIGPESPIDPCHQVAFYDAGLGTDDDVHGWERFTTGIRKLLASAAGRGIATNIADCYEFILNHWSPGDRIFIIGFSRGAYTARCLAQVLALCGVPVHESAQPNISFRRFSRSTRQVAERAVHQVYEHGAGRPRAEFESEREELGRRFRTEFGSDENGVPNASPHFIGVFDTVAALGAQGFKYVGVIALLGLIGAFFAATIGGAIATLGYLFGFRVWPVFWVVASIVAIFLILRTELQAWRFIDDWPKPGSRRKWHRIEWHAENYDRGLSGHVGYARQASAIDEDRADFPRVPWGRDTVIRQQQPDEPPPVVQLWFAGNHSDIGGSYPEEESRLSDITLQWMVDEATSIPGALIIDQTRLHAHPAPAGMQHSERESLRDRDLWWAPKWGPKLLREGWKFGDRKPAGYPVHPTVFERFASERVVQAAGTSPYRPQNLSEDERFAAFYKQGPSADPMDLMSARFVADDLSLDGRLYNQAKLLEAALNERNVTDAAIVVLPPNPIEDHDEYRDSLALRHLDNLLLRHQLSSLEVRCEDSGDCTNTRKGRLIFGANEQLACQIASSIGQMTTLIVAADGSLRSAPSYNPTYPTKGA